MLRLEGQCLAVWKVSSVKIFRLFIKLTLRKTSYSTSLEMYRNCHFIPVHHSDLVPLLGFRDLLHIFSDQIWHLERLENTEIYINLLPGYPDPLSSLPGWCWQWSCSVSCLCRWWWACGWCWGWSLSVPRTRRWSTRSSSSPPAGEHLSGPLPARGSLASLMWRIADIKIISWQSIIIIIINDQWMTMKL